MTRSIRNEFIRRMGCVRISLRHLDDCLRTGRLDDIEEEVQSIEQALLELSQLQHKLPRPERLKMKPRFVELRRDALRSLEIARRILDDSLKAMLVLVKHSQEAVGYGPGYRGGSFIVDREA